MRTNRDKAKTYGALAAGAITLALALALALAPPADAKPPGGGGGGNGGGGNGGGGDEPGPPPEGMLYYYTVTSVRGVEADGTNDEQAFDFNNVNEFPTEPSKLLYNHSGTDYRLWLGVEDSVKTYDVTATGHTNMPTQDLYVYVEPVGSDVPPQSYQVTDLFGAYFVNSSLRWSNDGQDSFISFKGLDLSDSFAVDQETGETSLNGMNHPGIFRVNISGSEIFAGAMAGPAKVTPIVTIESHNGASDFEHGWSADGSKVAYTFEDADQSSDVWIQSLDETGEPTGDPELIFEGTDYTENPRFSPTADLISVNDAGGAKIIDAATGATTVTVGTATGPYWSPDGNHLSFVGVKRKGPSVDFFLSRIALDTGDVTNVKPLETNSIVPWVSNDNRPPPEL